MKDLRLLTPEAFVILKHLQTDVFTSGEELRLILSTHLDCSASSFYRLMQDLERKKYACGRYERLDRGEKIMKQRTYKATDAGHSALERTREFFI